MRKTQNNLLAGVVLRLLKFIGRMPDKRESEAFAACALPKWGIAGRMPDKRESEAFTACALPKCCYLRFPFCSHGKNFFHFDKFFWGSMLFQYSNDSFNFFICK